MGTRMPGPGRAAFINGVPVPAGMSRFIFCVNRGTNCSAEGTANNCTIAPADLMAYCRASSSTKAATDDDYMGSVVGHLHLLNVNRPLDARAPRFGPLRGVGQRETLSSRRPFNQSNRVK